MTRVIHFLFQIWIDSIRRRYIITFLHSFGNMNEMSFLLLTLINIHATDKLIHTKSNEEKFYIKNTFYCVISSPLTYLIMNVICETHLNVILKYIIKFEVKQIMSRDDFIQEMIYKYVIRDSLNQWCRKKPISNKSSIAQWTKYYVLSKMGTSQYAWLNLKISTTRPYKHFRDTSVNLFNSLYDLLIVW